MIFNLNRKMAQAVAVTVGSVVAVGLTSALTAVIVASAKNKEAIDRMDKEMREKHDRFREVEAFRKEELDKLNKNRQELELEIAKLDEIRRKREVELKAIKTNLAGGDSEKLILTLVSGLQDSVLEMSMATMEMRKEITKLREQVNGG